MYLLVEYRRYSKPVSQATEFSSAASEIVPVVCGILARLKTGEMKRFLHSGNVSLAIARICFVTAPHQNSRNALCYCNNVLLASFADFRNVASWLDKQNVTLVQVMLNNYYFNFRSIGPYFATKSIESGAQNF